MRLFPAFLLPIALCAAHPAAAMPLTQPMQQEVCDYVLNPTATTRKGNLDSATQREGWIDINNDDVDEHIEINDGQPAYSTYDGSALPAFVPDEAFAAEFDAREKDGSERSWLHYRNHTFLTLARPGAPRDSLWYINPDLRVTKLCSVTATKRVKTARPDRNFQNEFDVDELCENVARQRRMDYIAPKEITPVDVDMNLSARAELAVDIDHDGVEDPAYYTQYVLMGNDKTCSFNYFLLKSDVHPKGSEETALSPLGNQLYWAQHSRPDDAIGQAPTQPCESLQDTRLFRFDGRVFLERGNLAKGAENPATYYHQVWYFKDGKRFNLCRFDIRQDATYRIEPLPSYLGKQAAYPEESQVD